MLYSHLIIIFGTACLGSASFRHMQWPRPAVEIRIRLNDFGAVNFPRDIAFLPEKSFVFLAGGGEMLVGEAGLDPL